MEDTMVYDVAVIGCGVIGAAVSYNLAKYNLKTLVLEMNNDVAMGTTKANSAILHSGYDPKPGSDMAFLNVRGVELAKEICENLNVSYKQIGSLVIGFDNEDKKRIQELYEYGLANNVPGIKVITGNEAREIDENLSEKVVSALYAPSCAVVDPWEYALAMTQVAVKNGVDLKLNTKVTGIKEENIYTINTNNGSYQAKYIVNGAGIDADVIHNMVEKPSFTTVPNKGEYFLLDKSQGQMVKHVIFQCPTKLGKGVLISPTVHGNLIVGPNSVDTTRKDLATTFDGLQGVESAAYKSVPKLDFRENIRNFAGLRAHSDRPDFIIEFAKPNFLDIGGIQSPGLSSAAAIGERAVLMLKDNGLNLTKKTDFDNSRTKIKFNQLNEEEKRELIKENPQYGRVICRCCTVTEGEIIASIKAPIPPCSINGVKRRTMAGMGRCQGGFCAPRVVEILARELNVSPMDILQEQEGTYIFTGHTKDMEQFKSQDKGAK